ncbi:alanine racemase [Glaciihabitans sp. UYNi722]|uniref:alanine racemase n=1 Tax=Glaciihabitans sp. UYNi722 TaxID=3156344 RepID=UPI0033938C24
MNDPADAWFETMPAVAIIDLDAYAQNLRVLRSRVAPAEFMAVVKADAYGHGLLPITRAAVNAGVGWIGALDIDTALRLRDNGIGDETAIFAWLLATGDDLEAAVVAGVDLGVSSVEQLEAIAAMVDKRRARVHLKIDTGLHRNGLSPEEWGPVVERAVALKDRIDLVGAWTHIAEASDDEDTAAISRFHEAVGVAQRAGAELQVRHLAASAAAFARGDSRLDLVRVGAFSYGISPGGGVSAAELGLVPVMTLTAPVSSVRDDTAYLAIGTGNGISSAAVNRVSIAIAGRRYPIVEMGLDWIGVRVDANLVTRGDRAVLFGTGSEGEATLQEWADATDTIGEEIVTRLGSSIRRHYRGAVS